MTSLACKPVELMAIILARDISDGEKGAAGIAAAVPNAAMFLARRLHAPNFSICGELVVNPKPRRLYASVSDHRYHYGAEAEEGFLELFGSSNKGLDFWFHSGIQIDKYGNVNLHLLGSVERPTFRGPALANVSFAVTSKRFYLYPMVHNRRVFVDKVDFISVPGNLQGPESKAMAGLRNEGPRLCVSPLAVMDFDPVTLRMRLHSVHEGHTVDEVLANTGFDLIVPERVPITEPPTEEELRVLREEVDPDGLLRSY